MTRSTHAQLPSVLLLALVGAASACGSSSGTVRVPLDAQRTQFREAQKLDCAVYDERGKSLTAGLNFSALWGGASAGPYVQRAEQVGVKWDKGVQMLVAQYKELCGRYNGGALTQQEYDGRLSEIDQLYGEAAGIRQSADEVARRHSKESFSELDRETSAPAPSPAERAQEAEQVAAAVDALVGKLGAP
jgi:hypothetical protein